MTSGSPAARTIFLEAVERVPEERWEEFVKDRCGTDLELFQRVQCLLIAHQDLGDFHEPEHAATLTPTAASTTSVRTGTLIGPYKIREQIGEGGMGEVFVAEQTEPVRRKVALKIIKAGMSTKGVIARFETERQALAMMDHPNIARVFDGGATQAGEPFFVMELVQGVPITHYCDQLQLSTTDRLRLYIKVCRAVEHAHQKGIIHRDLKPSNVLVAEIDGEAVPKVIDFGIAKAVNQKLSDQTVYTQFSQMVGSPLYMSPEQAGLGVIDIDTRSDVYSLGAMLYELLTGSTTIDAETLKQSGFDEMRRIIREQDPAKPSRHVSTLSEKALSTVAAARRSEPRRLSDCLRGELDWIVMKALEKDRNRRYESARDLVQDVQRHLDDKPVQAGPPSIFYRATKFAKRNRRTLIASSLVATLAIITLSQFAVVTGQRNRQRRELEANVQSELTAAATALESNALGSADRHLSRAQGVLDNSSRSHFQFTDELNRLTSRLETYRRHQQQFANLSQNYREMWMLADTRDKEAKTLARESLDLFGVINDQDWQRRLQDSTLAASDRAELKEMLFETLLLLAYVERKDRSDKGMEARLRYLNLAESFHEPIYSLYRLRRDVYADLGDDDNAEKTESLMEGTKCSTALDYFLLGQLTARVEKNAQAAIPYYEKALMLAPNHFPSLFYLAYRLDQIGNAAEAARVYHACLALRPSEWLVLNNLGVCLKERNKYGQGIEYLTQALASVKGKEAAGVLTNRAAAYITLDMYDKALADLNRAIELDSELIEAYWNRAVVHRHAGELEESVSDCNRALELCATSNVPTATLAAIYSNRGGCYFDLQDFGRALIDIEQSIQLQPRNSGFHSHRAWALAAQDRYAEAAESFRRAIELDPNNSQLYGMAAQFHASCPDQAFRDPSRTLHLAQKAVELDERSASAWEVLAFAQYRSGDHTSAIDSASKVLDLDDDVAPDLYLILALAHQAAGHHEDALGSYSQATKLIQEKKSEDKDLLRLRDEVIAQLGLNSELNKPHEETDERPGKAGQTEADNVNGP